MTIAECTACGACCTSQSERYVRVTGDDWERLGHDADHWVAWSENRAFMRMREGRCAALEISRAGRFTCRVYERRPAVCRELERASPACEAEIARKHDAPARRLPIWPGT